MLALSEPLPAPAAEPCTCAGDCCDLHERYRCARCRALVPWDGDDEALCKPCREPEDVDPYHAADCGTCSGSGGGDGGWACPACRGTGSGPSCDDDFYPAEDA